MKAAVLFALVVIALALAISTLPVYPLERVSASPQATIIKRERVTVTTTGVEGSASGSNTTQAVINGQVLRIDVDYGTLTTTTDITIGQTNESVAALVVTKSDSVTDATYYPSVILTDNGGTARTYDGTRPVVMPYPAADQFTVTLAQTTAATPAVTVDIYYRSE